MRGHIHLCETESNFINTIKYSLFNTPLYANKIQRTMEENQEI